jgi:hypothetical protein
MVEGSSLIVLVKLTPAGEKFDIQVAEVLKGVPPRTLLIPSQISSYKSEGLERRSAAIGHALVDLDALTPTNRRIIFLREDDMGRFSTFHPACVQPEDQRNRVLEILAMRRDPARFVASAKHAGDTDLIYLLGVQFYALRITAPAVPLLEKYAQPYAPVSDEIPWQRTHFTVRFTFQSARKPMLQMEPLAAKGALPDFIRKADAMGAFEKSDWSERVKIPPEFGVTVDTNGPQNVGGLSFAAAANFLRTQLRLEKLDVIQTAYTALAKLMDSDAVPIAIEMLNHPDRKFRREAAKFLSYGQDPRCLEPLCAALDALPRCIRYAAEGYNEDDHELSGAVGKAVLNLRDPQTVPALKRAAFKGYAGDWIAMSLSRLGDETAFEPLLSHLRDPSADHYTGELLTMVQRSNLPIEPWMKAGFGSEDREGKRRHTARWLEWWDQHKKGFRSIRTWEEVQQIERQERMRSKGVSQ